jgi:ribonuclease P protein component
VLRRPAEFEAVLRSGVRISSKSFVARALFNAGETARLGLIAGRKAAKRAVDRNRAKRLVREIFRAHAPAFGPFDVTIQLRSHLRGQNNEAVRTELEGLFDSLGRRCKADRARAADAARQSADGGDAAATGAAPHRHQ